MGTSQGKQILAQLGPGKFIDTATLSHACRLCSHVKSLEEMVKRVREITKSANDENGVSIEKLATWFSERKFNAKVTMRAPHSLTIRVPRLFVRVTCSFLKN